MATNFERLKDAYKAWHDTKGASVDVWGALMADTFHFVSNDETQPGLSFSRDTMDRVDAMARLRAIFDEWEMVHFTPETFVDDGSRIAMFGRCGYRSKATGKVANCLVGSLWVFDGDKAISTTEIFDSAVAVAAATPDPAGGKGA